MRLWERFLLLLGFRRSEAGRSEAGSSEAGRPGARLYEQQTWDPGWDEGIGKRDAQERDASERPASERLPSLPLESWDPAADEDTWAAALAGENVNHELERRWNTLSVREKQVAALICRDYTNRQIADQLIVSPETVKSHARNVLRKFNLHSRSQLRLLLRRWDLSPWEDLDL